MTQAPGPSPLIAHTLDSLCKELISGRAVLVDEGGSVFRLSSPQARSLLGWYHANRPKWEGNVQKRDLESLADALSAEPREFAPSVPGEGSGQARVLHLKSMRAHRFGGIHAYGSLDEEPEDFAYEFVAPVTLIEGPNASGKTSLLSAITWCLTGLIYRSQRPPESAEKQVPLEIADEPDSPEGDARAYDMTAITPMPSKEVLQSLRGDQLLPLDTWVELSFVDEEGNEAGRIRRMVTRTTTGRPK